MKEAEFIERPSPILLSNDAATRDALSESKAARKLNMKNEKTSEGIDDDTRTRWGRLFPQLLMAIGQNYCFELFCALSLSLQYAGEKHF